MARTGRFVCSNLDCTTTFCRWHTCCVKKLFHRGLVQMQKFPQTLDVDRQTEAYARWFQSFSSPWIQKEEDREFQLPSALPQVSAVRQNKNRENITPFLDSPAHARSGERRANEVVHDDLGPLSLLGSRHSRRGTRPMGPSALKILEGSASDSIVSGGKRASGVGDGGAAAAWWFGTLDSEAQTGILSGSAILQFSCFNPSERTIPGIKSRSFTAILHCKGMFEMHCSNAAML